MKVLGEWKNISIYGVGTGFLRLEERAGHYWIALYEKLSAGDAIQEKTAVAVDAIKENPEAAAGAALTAAASSAVKAVAASLGADRSAMRRIQVFENDSAKEFSKTFAESNEAVLRKHLIFEKELDSLSDCSNSGNTVSMMLNREYRLIFSNLWSGENMSREFFEEVESIRKKNEAVQFAHGNDWTLDANGFLTIKGGGRMPNWKPFTDDQKTPWYSLRTAIKAAHIADGFVNIGSCAFDDCENLTSVYIPYSVTNIGSSAFAGCTSLRAIDIPNSVTDIGSTAFAGCTSLRDIDIPNSVTNIDDYAFQHCENLMSIRFSQQIAKIGWCMFNNCKSLRSIDIPHHVTRIENYAFQYCENLTTVKIPNSVISIGSEVFVGCKRLAEIRIPNSVTKIGMGVFKECKNLKRVWMPARFDGPLFKLRYGISKDIVTFT